MIAIQVKGELGMKKFLKDVQRQVPFATSVAINETAKQAQVVQRKHQKDVFDIKRPQFLDRAVKIKPFANKRSLSATIKIDPPGGQKRADILTKFEDGETKRPIAGGKALAIPDQAKRTGAGLLRKNQRPRSFDFHQVTPTMWRAPKGVFMIKRADGTGGIFQRVSNKGQRRGKKFGRRSASSIATRNVRDLNIVTLFRFTPQAKIDDRLDFEENITGVVTARFAANFTEALEKAIKASGNRRGSRQQRRIARADVSGVGRRS